MATVVVVTDADEGTDELTPPLPPLPLPLPPHPDIDRKHPIATNALIVLIPLRMVPPTASGRRQTLQWLHPGQGLCCPSLPDKDLIHVHSWSIDRSRR